ncbi:MAG: ribose 5-phosphate isomerase B [Fimbriimonadaceae bacterium]|nr:ribose 5-phosphate isomerase B [Fimbriimonadaceae bacterium]QYK57567.1 MAG: ribose 5-phosphate isomerase B [Fimbriimonadaceae bacterium]
MRLALGSDHAGFDLRQNLAAWAEDQGHTTVQFGATGHDPFDYPDAAAAVVQAVLSGEADLGALVCGTGIGVCIAANRHRGVRAALACSPQAAVLARQHNHANVVCLGARTMDPEQAREIFQVFVSTQPDCQERHVRRVRKLDGNDGPSRVVSIIEEPHG